MAVTLSSFTLFEADMVRLTFLISMVVSWWIYHRRDYIPLGLVVPGTLILLARDLTHLTVVVAVSGLLWFFDYVSQRTIFRSTIFNLHERLLLLVIGSVVLTSLFSLVMPSLTLAWEGVVLGLVTPALIVNELRQDARGKVKSLGLALGVTGLIYVLINVSSIHGLYPIRAQRVEEFKFFLPGAPRELSVELLYGLVAILQFLLYRFWRIRGIGLVSGVYLIFLIMQPVTYLLVLFSAVVSYLVVILLKKFMFLYGHRLFLMATLTAGTVYTFYERVLVKTTQGYIHGSTNIAGIIVCGVLVSTLADYRWTQAVKRMITTGVVVAGAAGWLLLLS